MIFLLPANECDFKIFFFQVALAFETARDKTANNYIVEIKRMRDVSLFSLCFTWLLSLSPLFHFILLFLVSPSLLPPPIYPIFSLFFSISPFLLCPFLLFVPSLYPFLYFFQSPYLHRLPLSSFFFHYLSSYSFLHIPFIQNSFLPVVRKLFVLSSYFSYSS